MHRPLPATTRHYPPPHYVTTSRLPISTQLIAPHFHEATLLALASAPQRVPDLAFPGF